MPGIARSSRTMSGWSSRAALDRLLAVACLGDDGEKSCCLEQPRRAPRGSAGDRRRRAFAGPYGPYRQGGRLPTRAVCAHRARLADLAWVRDEVLLVALLGAGARVVPRAGRRPPRPRMTCRSLRLFLDTCVVLVAVIVVGARFRALLARTAPVPDLFLPRRVLPDRGRHARIRGRAVARRRPDRPGRAVGRDHRPAGRRRRRSPPLRSRPASRPAFEALVVAAGLPLALAAPLDGPRPQRRIVIGPGSRRRRPSRCCLDCGVALQALLGLAALVGFGASPTARAVRTSIAGSPSARRSGSSRNCTPCRPRRSRASTCPRATSSGSSPTQSCWSASGGRCAPPSSAARSPRSVHGSRGTYTTASRSTCSRSRHRRDARRRSAGRQVIPHLQQAAARAQQEARFAVLALSSASGTAPFEAALKPLRGVPDRRRRAGRRPRDRERRSTWPRRADRDLPDRPGGPREHPPPRGRTRGDVVIGRRSSGERFVRSRTTARASTRLRRRPGRACATCATAPWRSTAASPSEHPRRRHGARGRAADEIPFPQRPPLGLQSSAPGATHTARHGRALWRARGHRDRRKEARRTSAWRSFPTRPERR